MSSILTNTSAMVALQTLKSINGNLGRTQSDISTGKSISTARDNAAIWAISKTMESDVLGFKGISDSLSLGSSTIAVARSASEKVTDLLNEVKQKIVAAQEENQDRTKIQQDIVALRDQITSITGAAQFNGLNLLSNRKAGVAVADMVGNTGTGAGILGSGQVTILSSLDRSSDGSVKAAQINASKADLGSQAMVWGTLAENPAAAMTVLASGTGVAVSSTYTIVGDTTAARRGNAILAGDGYEMTGLGVTAGSVRYVARDGDTQADVAQGLANALNFETAKTGVKLSAVAEGNRVSIINNTGVAAALGTVGTSSGGTAGGGLELLAKVDVTTASGARGGLAAIEGLIQTAIKASADFGSTQKRIDIQRDFVSSLSDSLKAGIGSMVDADMEEASARLQALQVQQQLGIQALSIANQAPQNILALFR